MLSDQLALYSDYRNYIEKKDEAAIRDDSRGSYRASVAARMHLLKLLSEQHPSRVDCAKVESFLQKLSKEYYRTEGPCHNLFLCSVVDKYTRSVYSLTQRNPESKKT